jgi:tetratricopeptide (TPR) repeat protein
LTDPRRYEEALEAFDRALASDPQNLEALMGKGQVLAELGRYEEALRMFDRALELNPDSAETLVDRGKVLARLAYYEEALRMFDRALAVIPHSAEALVGKGQVLARLAYYEEALEAFEVALIVDVHNLEALVGKGQVARVLERYEDAISSFNLALKHNPANTEDWVTRGQILAQLGSIAEPEETFDRIQHDFMGFQGRRRDPDPVSLGFLIYAAVIASSSLVVAIANRRDTKRYRAEDQQRERERDEGQIRMYLGRIDRTLNRLDESFRSLVSVFDQEEVIDAPFALGAAPILADEALMAELERLQDTFFAAGKELYSSLDELSARIGEEMQRGAQRISQDLMGLFEDSRTARTVVRFILDIARILERLSTFIEQVGADYRYFSPSATVRQLTLNQTISYLSEREAR